MKHDKNIEGCGREDQLVSYLYDDLRGPESAEYETHIASCARCTSELASFRSVRADIGLAVKAGQMPRPIPNPAKTSAPKTEVSPLLASLAGIFKLTPGLAAAALLLGIITVGLVVFNIEKEHSPALEMAANLQSSVEPTGTPATALTPSPADVPADPQTVTRSDSTIPTTPPTEKRRTKAIKHRRSDPVTEAKEAVTLSDIEETEDDSLRLSDLFADLGVE